MKRDIENRKDVEILINSFYDKVRPDEVLGYIFEDVAKVDWEHHTPIICDFWESVLFQTNVYRGNPMPVHMRLHAQTTLTKSHFDRWVSLFTETVDTYFEGEKAELAKQRAISIATMMRIKILETPQTLI